MTRKMIRLASSTDVRAAGGADSHLHLASALQEGRKITLCPKASGESRLRGFFISSSSPSERSNRRGRTLWNFPLPTYDDLVHAMKLRHQRRTIP
jgi:hypothetical protein